MITFIDDLEREFWFEAFARHTRSKRFLAFGTPAEFADFCVLQMRERTENRGMKVASPLLLAALREMVDYYGPAHEPDCPGDDTCDCKHKPFNDRVNAALKATEAK